MTTLSELASSHSFALRRIALKTRNASGRMLTDEEHKKIAIRILGRSRSTYKKLIKLNK